MATLLFLITSSILFFSQGAGIVWPTGIGNLELNVCRVLKRAASDQVKHGIQFGITPST